MKKICILLLVILVLPLLSSGQDSLIGLPMPILPNKTTLDGKNIDADYFKGHITIVSFMYIGCMACMNEITSLNKIKAAYAGNDKVQLLCIARQTKAQMISFNGNDTTKLDPVKPMNYSYIRRAEHADPISYPIMAICDNEKTRSGYEGNKFDLKGECKSIEENYNVNSYPVIFYIDEKGIVRNTHSGGPATKESPDFYNEIKRQVDLLLKP